MVTTIPFYLQVSQMKSRMERGMEMMRTLGTPMPHPPPVMPQPLPFRSPSPVAGHFPGGFVQIPSAENDDYSNIYGG